MPTSNAEELGLFLKCTVIGRGVFGPCACSFGGTSPSSLLRFWIALFTVLKRCCGKVMFLHLSMILFTGGGGGGKVYIPLGRYPALRETTAADGTHPCLMRRKLK